MRTIQEVFNLAIQKQFYSPLADSPKSDEYPYMCDALHEMYNEDLISIVEWGNAKDAIKQYQMSITPLWKCHPKWERYNQNPHINALTLINCFECLEIFEYSEFRNNDDGQFDLCLAIFKNWNTRPMNKVEILQFMKTHGI